MDNEFLHRINIEALKKELNLDVPSIAKLAGISENGVYKWAWPKESNGARPSFNAVIKLLQAGASSETLFGIKTQPFAVPPEIANDPEFRAGFQKAIDAIDAKVDAAISAKLDDALKAKGLI